MASNYLLELQYLEVGGKYYKELSLKIAFALVCIVF